MALYVYKKYNAQYYSYPPTYELRSGAFDSGGQRTISGYTGYSFNSSTGVITYTGGYSSTNNGRRVSGSSSSVTVMDSDIYGYTANTYNSVLVSSGGSGYTRGTYIGQVVAEDGTLPNGWRHSDGFWYERKVLAGDPVLTAPNGGEVFDKIHEIIFTVPRTGLRAQIELSRDNGATWSTLISRSAVDATSYTHDFTNVPESSVAKVRIKLYDGELLIGQDESNGVFAIRHNVAPSPPTLVTPVGITIDYDTANVYRWIHNDDGPQNYAQVQYRENDPANGFVSDWYVKDISSTAQETLIVHDPGVGVGERVRMEWRVRTQDQYGLLSAWSDIRVYYIGAKPNVPEITSPVNPIITARPIISWISPGQVAYRLRILNALGDLEFDSGTVNSIATARTAPFDFINGSQYTIELATMNNFGSWSDIAVVERTVAYTPPAKPQLQAFGDGPFIMLAISNPSPEVGEPEPIGNDVYKLIDGSWTLIATDVLTNYRDYSYTSGIKESYFVRTRGANGTYRDSDIVDITVILPSTYLSSTSIPNNTVDLKYAIATTRSLPQSRTIVRLEGRKRPVARLSDYQAESLSLSTLCETREEMNSILNLIGLTEPLLYRDPEGRKAYISIDTVSEEDIVGTTFTRVSITADAVDYEEAI